MYDSRVPVMSEGAIENVCATSVSRTIELESLSLS